MLIQRGDRHEIRHAGSDLWQTLNFCVPPACTKVGDALPAAESTRGKR